VAGEAGALTDTSANAGAFTGTVPGGGTRIEPADVAGDGGAFTDTAADAIDTYKRTCPAADATDAGTRTGPAAEATPGVQSLPIHRIPPVLADPRSSPPTG